jgi:hypothetical protein
MPIEGIARYRAPVRAYAAQGPAAVAAGRAMIAEGLTGL